MRNLLSPGEYIVPIPLGCPVCIRYNSKGVLDSVKLWNIPNTVGFDFEERLFTDELLTQFRQANIAPATISLKGGSTYVYGSLVPSEPVTTSGYLPKCILDTFLDGSLFSRSKLFTFFVESKAAMFRGAVPVRKWLSLAHFNVLPGFIVPNSANDIPSLLQSSCKNVIDTDSIVAYAVFNLDKFKLCSTEIRQVTATDYPYKRMNEHGVIFGRFPTNCGEMEYGWYDIINYEISKDTRIILEDNIVKKTYNSKVVTRKRDLVCPTCGKIIPIRATGVARCSDSNCLSRCYLDTKQVLSTLKLPDISYTDYQKHVKNKTIKCPADILTVEPYSEMPVECSLTTLLTALIPQRYVSDKKVISLFVTQCKNSVETVMYYLENSKKIHSDLNFGNIDTRELQEYLTVDNVEYLEAVLESPRIRIEQTDKYFEAYPILRSTVICITGDFGAGNQDDIKGILGSYSATVVTEFTPDVRYVLVGDKKSNIDGRILAAARSVNIPVVDEKAFFERFEIDRDMASNLL